MTAERHLDVEPRDFRLWVCLHEETHRAQFGGVPWLGGHLIAEIHDYLALADSSPGEVLRRFRHGLGAIASAVRGDPAASLVDAVQRPEQREVFDRITALMSLLEGHADHVMDEVGPEIVPTVSVIRERFDQRRNEPGAVDGLARRLLGLDAKMRQYSDGRAFVTHVVSRVGLEGFNRVWTSPQTLPSKDEILIMTRSSTPRPGADGSRPTCSRPEHVGDGRRAAGGAPSCPRFARGPACRRRRPRRLLGRSGLRRAGHRRARRP